MVLRLAAPVADCWWESYDPTDIYFYIYRGAVGIYNLLHYRQYSILLLQMNNNLFLLPVRVRH